MEWWSSHTHAHTQHLRVSKQQLSPLTVTHFLCFRSFSSLVDSRVAKRTCGLCCTPYLRHAIVCGGTRTVIPAENNTSFSLVKPSLRAHHREQALRSHDIISLPGQAVHLVFPRTLRCFTVPLCEAETSGGENIYIWETAVNLFLWWDLFLENKVIRYPPSLQMICLKGMEPFPPEFLRYSHFCLWDALAFRYALRPLRSIKTLKDYLPTPWYKYLHLSGWRAGCMQTVSSQTDSLCFSPPAHTQSNLRHWEQTKKERGPRCIFKSCTKFNPHSYSQSLRLISLTGEGTCLRIALTAGACFSVLGLPFRDAPADLHSGILSNQNFFFFSRKSHYLKTTFYIHSDYLWYWNLFYWGGARRSGTTGATHTDAVFSWQRCPRYNSKHFELMHYFLLVSQPIHVWNTLNKGKYSEKNV